MKLISLMLMIFCINIFAGFIYTNDISDNLTGIIDENEIISGGSYGADDFSIQWRIVNLGGSWSYAYIIQTLNPHLEGVILGTSYDNGQSLFSYDNLPIDLYGNRYNSNTIYFISELEPAWGHFYIYQGLNNYIYNSGMVSPGAKIPVPVPEPLVAAILIIGAIVARPVDKKKRIRKIKE